MPKVSMTVNGRAVSGEVEGRTLLVEFLREGLRLTGTHVGCDTGQCGACVVHVDGVSVKSCNVFALDLEGGGGRTIEGMANPDGSLGVIQAAFQTHHGLQCGFCTPGMVMTAAALLKENAGPSEAEIREYLEGNICRCTGYHNIVKAIQAAAERAEARPGRGGIGDAGEDIMPKDSGIGAPLKRREDVRFLTGKGRYTDDINRPGPGLCALPALGRGARADHPARHRGGGGDAGGAQDLHRRRLHATPAACPAPGR